RGELPPPPSIPHRLRALQLRTLEVSRDGRSSRLRLFPATNGRGAAWRLQARCYFTYWCVVVAPGLRRPLRPPGHRPGRVRGPFLAVVHRGRAGRQVSRRGGGGGQEAAQPPAAEGPAGPGSLDGQGEDPGLARRAGPAGGGVGGPAKGVRAEPARAA